MENHSHSRHRWQHIHYYYYITTKVLVISDKLSVLRKN